MLENIAEDCKVGVDSLYKQNNEAVYRLYSEADSAVQKKLSVAKGLAAVKYIAGAHNVIIWRPLGAQRNPTKTTIQPNPFRTVGFEVAGPIPI